MTHIFTLPGDWTHPYLLLRLLEVIESPWSFTEDGFLRHGETGEQAQLRIGAALAGLGDAFAAATDLSRAPLDDALVEEINQHQHYAQIAVGQDPDDPIASILVALRAANAVVDGGALGVHFAGSGLAHGADAFQALMKGVEGAATDTQQLKALMGVLVRYQFSGQSMTFGMGALGLPDVVLLSRTNPDRAIGRLERAALAQRENPREVRTDARGLPEHLANPFGLILLQD